MHSKENRKTGAFGPYRMKKVPNQLNWMIVVNGYDCWWPIKMGDKTIETKLKCTCRQLTESAVGSRQLKYIKILFHSFFFIWLLHNIQISHKLLRQNGMKRLLFMCIIWCPSNNNECYCCLLFIRFLYSFSHPV